MEPESETQISEDGNYPIGKYPNNNGLLKEKELLVPVHTQMMRHLGICA
jgi:hypothetical protein